MPGWLPLLVWLVFWPQLCAWVSGFCAVVGPDLGHAQNEPPERHTCDDRRAVVGFASVPAVRDCSPAGMETHHQTLKALATENPTLESLMKRASCPKRRDARCPSPADPAGNSIDLIASAHPDILQGEGAVHWPPIGPILGGLSWFRFTVAALQTAAAWAVSGTALALPAKRRRVGGSARCHALDRGEWKGGSSAWVPTVKPGLVSSKATASPSSSATRRRNWRFHWHGLTPPNGGMACPASRSRFFNPAKLHLHDFPLELPGTNWMHSHHSLRRSG